MNKSLWFLVVAQALFMIANTMFITIAPLLGKNIAPSENYATAPFAVSMLSMLIFSFPLSVIMGKIGRRYIFMLGSFSGALAGIIFFIAIQKNSFVGLLVASVFFGLSMASATFYRFAAMELVSPNNQSKAISAVMAVGVFSAFIGPNLGSLTKDYLFEFQFLASVLLFIPLSILSLILIYFIKWPISNNVIKSTTTTELATEMASSNMKIWRPIFTSMIAFAVMILVMTATPLHMGHHEYSFGDITWVLQWHLVGMYAPSFFVGRLVSRMGLEAFLLLGSIILIFGVSINLAAENKLMLTAGLLLVGAGWNFLYLASSQWLLQTYTGTKTSIIQGINEVCVVGIATLCAFSSGWLLNTFGWKVLHFSGLALLAVLFLVLLTNYTQAMRAREFEAA